MKLAQIYERFSLFWLTIALGLLYWVPSLIWYDELIEPVKWGTYSVALVVMIVVFAAWVPSAIKVYWNNTDDGPSLLILAVFLVAFVFLQSAIFRYVYLQFDQPQWMYNSPVGGFISYQVAILGILITVAVIKSSDVHIENLKRRIGWGLFISGLLVGAFAGSVVTSLGSI